MYYTDINLMALKRCVRNNEKAEMFCFPHVVHPCGSHGCLIGNDVLALLGRKFTSASEVYRHCQRDLSAYLSEWRYARYGFKEGDKISGWLFYRPNGKGDTKQQRVNRLRKFIAYVERKRAMLHEPDGRISERSRKQEGDWLVCPKVLESLAVAS